MFRKLTGIQSNNTIRKAIGELIEKGKILRYKIGKGSNTKSFFWIDTDKNYRIYEAVVTGRISIEEAQNLILLCQLEISAL